MARKRILEAGSLKSKRTLNITVSRESLSQMEEEVLKEYKRTVKLRGFRPGKVPASLIMRHFSEEIKSTAKERVLRDAISKEIEKVHYNPVSSIRVVDEQENESGDINISVEFEVIPEFDIPNLSTIKLEKRIPRVLDSEIEEEIEKLRKRMAEHIPLEREARDSDILYVEFEERDDRKKLLDRRDIAYIQLLRNEVAEELYQALLGKKKGDVVNIEKEFQTEDGKIIKRLYTYKIKSVREEKLPEVNDEFAQYLGYKDIDDMRNRLRDEIHNLKKREYDNEFEWRIINEIYNRVQFELPESLVQDEIELLKRKLDENMLKNTPSIEEHLRSWASLNIKRRIILDRFAEDEEIGVTEEELKEEIKRMATEYKVNADEYRKRLEKRGALEVIKTMLRQRKASELIKERVKMEVILE